MTGAIIAILTIAAIGCNTPTPAPAPVPPAMPDEAQEVQAVEKVLHDWYLAMEHHDTAGTARPLTAKFFIYEDTNKYRRAEMLKSINSGFGAGQQTATISDLETMVHGDVAWSSFRNQEVFTPTKGKPEHLNFLETVVFVKKDGVWKMDRYHATRINRPK